MPKMPRNNKKESKGYEKMVSDGINKDNCEHPSTKINEAKPAWEMDKVSIIIECKLCTIIGHVDGEVIYDDVEIDWL